MKILALRKLANRTAAQPHWTLRISRNNLSMTSRAILVRSEKPPYARKRNYQKSIQRINRGGIFSNTSRCFCASSAFPNL